MTSMKMTAMTMMATLAKVKLKIKRCSEWRGTRAGTFYTGTRGKKNVVVTIFFFKYHHDLNIY